MRSMLAFLLVVGATGFSVDFSDEAWKQRPINKVVNLLKDMQTQLQKEADEDADMYGKLGCWCHTNDAEKSKAIADANQRVADLTAAIEGYTAKDSMLETQIEKLNAEVAKASDMLAQAAGIRSKENAEFLADEKDMSSSGASLKSAVEALGAAHGAVLSQQSLMQVQQVLNRHVTMHRDMFHKVLSRKQLVLLQQGGKYHPEYAPQSGAIFGILKQMKETFESNLASSQSDEAKAASEFASLKGAKQAQIAAATELGKSKSVELAETKANNAQAKQDLADTNGQLAADTTFLENLRGKCENADAEYAARLKVRTEEILAVSETINILTSDDAQASFTRSNFIQMSLHTRRLSASDRNLARAAHMLRETAKKTGNAQLLKLAASVQMDGFVEVKASIDTMIAELKKTQQDELEQKGFCDDELKQNARSRSEKTDQKKDLEQTVADETATVQKLTEAIAVQKASVAAMQVEMKQAGVTREAENADFQVTVSDQRATQAILAKALDRLKDFYAAKLLQTSQMPAQKSYSKSGGGAGVVHLIEGIVTESKDLEQKALADENDAQQAYESFVADSNASIEAASTDIMNMSGAMARADTTNVDAQGDLRTTIQDLLKLGEYNAALHQDCDYLVQNYDVRQSNRAAEIDSLANAKAIFSGANFGFLQKN